MQGLRELYLYNNKHVGRKPSPLVLYRIKQIIVFLLCSTVLYSELKTVVGIKDIKLSQKKFIIQSYSGFVVTEDNFIILCDRKAGNFKIFDMKGNLRSIFGKKGYGPKEFKGPYLFDYYDKRMIIFNKGTRRIKVLKREKKMNFREIHEFVNYSYDAKYMNNILIYSSTPHANKKGESHTLFSIDLKTKKKQYLMEYEYIYGPKRLNISKNLIGRERPDELYLGFSNYCDFYENHIFYIWYGKLSIMRINRRTGAIYRFGDITKNYILPYASNEIKKSRKELNGKGYQNALRKMSWLTGIFAEKRFVGVIYANFDTKLSRWKKFLQLYKRDGTFIMEKSLQGFLSVYNRKSFFYDKKRGILYGISQYIDEEDDDIYKINSYKIIQ